MKELWNWQHQLFADDPDPDPEDTGTDKGSEEETKDEKTFSQAEVDKLLSERLARESAKLKKEAETAAKAELEAAKKEADKKAKMDAEEKAKYERDQLQQQIDELNAYKSRTELAKTVTSKLAEHEIVATDSLQNLLIGEDEDATSDNVDAFVREVNAAVERKIKEKARGTTPKSGGASKPHDDNGIGDEFKKRLAKYKKGS